MESEIISRIKKRVLLDFKIVFSRLKKRRSVFIHHFGNNLPDRFFSIQIFVIVSRYFFCIPIEYCVFPLQEIFFCYSFMEQPTLSQ